MSTVHTSEVRVCQTCAKVPPAESRDEYTNARAYLIVLKGGFCVCVPEEIVQTVTAQAAAAGAPAPRLKIQRLGLASVTVTFPGAPEAEEAPQASPSAPHKAEGVQEDGHLVFTPPPPREGRRRVGAHARPAGTPPPLPAPSLPVAAALIPQNVHGQPGYRRTVRLSTPQAPSPQRQAVHEEPRPHQEFEETSLDIPVVVGARKGDTGPQMLPANDDLMRRLESLPVIGGTQAPPASETSGETTIVSDPEATAFMPAQLPAAPGGSRPRNGGQRKSNRRGKRGR